jgi:hypothetical protein
VFVLAIVAMSVAVRVTVAVLVRHIIRVLLAGGAVSG